MTCNCHKKHDAELDFSKRPTEPCYLCAEKHLSAAAALARENGYEGANRAMLVGELVLAQWHLWTLDRPLAEKIRDARHAIQSGETADLLAIASLVTSKAGKSQSGDSASQNAELSEI